MRMTTTTAHMSFFFPAEQQQSSVLNAVASAAAAVVQQLLLRHSQRQRLSLRSRGSAPGRRFQKRVRRPVRSICKELGDIYFKRAYRKKFGTFQRLASMLRPYAIAASGQKQDSRNYLQNGRISPEVRLACALRWFAGGSVYDIMTTYGIGHTDAINSCWYVVDAINSHPSFKKAYPHDHSIQHSIAEGFR